MFNFIIKYGLYFELNFNHTKKANSVNKLQSMS